MGGLTGDVVVEDVIFLDSIVDDLLGVGVDDQAFPLELRQLLALRKWEWELELPAYIVFGDALDLVENHCESA